MTELCACGEPLHYSDPMLASWVELLIKRYGPTVVVTTPAGSWRVPRHYVALHGIKARDMPLLAATMGWPVALK